MEKKNGDKNPRFFKSPHDEPHPPFGHPFLSKEKERYVCQKK